MKQHTCSLNYILNYITVDRNDVFDAVYYSTECWEGNNLPTNFYHSWWEYYRDEE